MKSNREILIEARALISNRENWTQHAYARDKNNLEVNPQDPEARCFCAVGAIAKVIGKSDIHTSFDDLHECMNMLCENNDFTLFELNDGYAKIGSVHPHEAVLRMFDTAIEGAGE